MSMLKKFYSYFRISSCWSRESSFIYPSFGGSPQVHLVEAFVQMLALPFTRHPFSFLPLFFRNISKTAETILIKKIRRNHGISVYKKALKSEHRKNDICRDNICFVKMSVSLCFTKLFSAYYLHNYSVYSSL